MDILNTREKDILDKRFSDDLDTYNRLRMSYLLNCKYYTPDNFTTEDPFASFPATKDAFINFRFKYGTADEIKQRTAPVENASYSEMKK